MAGHALTTASSLACPHQGTVTAITTNRTTRADGAFILRAGDTFTIAGCTFSTAAGPMPCLTVQWVSPDLVTTVAASATLSEGSVGLCLNAASAPQGTVQVRSTQSAVTTS